MPNPPTAQQLITQVRNLTSRIIGERLWQGRQNSVDLQNAALDALAALFQEREDRIGELEGKFDKRVEREIQLDAHIVAFWQKHGLGSKVETSCLRCGKVGKRAITHLELPDIYICEECAP